MFNQIWNWLFHFDWSRAGGSSFVQLWTGLNLAFIAWDKYQEALNMPRSKCDEIIQATTCDILDGQYRLHIAALFLKWSSIPIVVHRVAWWICWSCALVFAILGFYMLYIDRFVWWTGVFALPTIAYVLCTLVSLGVFWAFAHIVGWCCKAVGPGNWETLKKKVSELEEKTRPKL